MSLLAQVGVTLSLFFSEVWGCLLTGADSMKPPLGRLLLNRGEKAEGVRAGFAWGELVLKAALALEIMLLSGYKSIFKRL